VYLTVDEGPGGFAKLKVVKRLHRELARDPEIARRFVEEVRLAARLTHPNIVQTFHVASDDEGLTLAMEYLEGAALSAVVDRLARAGRAFPLPLALWVVTQVLAGLHYAHELVDFDGRPLTVVHRDVAPANAILTFEGAVKLLDFGLAKAADSLVHTRTGDVRGRAAYMAPEQARGAPVDRRADVFSTGALLWELVSGESVWSDASEAQILGDLATARVPRPVPKGRPVSGPLVAICERALAPAPEARYPTALALQLAVEEHMHVEGLRADARAAAALMTELLGERRARVAAEVARAIERAQASDDPAVSALSAGRISAPPLLAPPSERAVSRDSSQPSATLPFRRRRSASWWVVPLLAAATLASAVLAVRRASSPKAAAPATSSTCTSNAACEGALGAPALCRAGACTPVAASGCRVAAGSAAADDTLWIGAVASPDAADGLLLALGDFVDVARGLPPLDGVGAPRSLGAVICDPAAPDALAHLATLGLPLVLGARAGAPRAGDASGSGAGAFAVASTGDPAMAAPGAWRLAPRPEDAEDAAQRAIDAGLIGAGGTAARVAWLRSRDTPAGAAAADPAALAAEALRLHPDPTVVVVVDADPAPIVEAVERSTATRNARPRYLLVSPAADASLEGPLRAHAAARIFRLRPDGSPSAVARFRKRFGARFGRAPSVDAATAYDAFYLVAYAAFLADGGAPARRLLAQVATAAATAPADDARDLAPAKIFDTLDRLRRRAPVSFAGAAGIARFDEGGQLVRDFVLVCPGGDASPRFDARTRTWGASKACR